MPGPPIDGVVAGHPHRYNTVALCTRQWWHDDLGYDQSTDDPLDWYHPRARTAYDRGYALGVADRAGFHTCPCTHCTRQENP
jgi:hypothetical protein